MHIHIQNRDLGFFTQEAVTIQKFEVTDGEKTLVWCNHAEAETQEIVNEIYRPDQADIVWKSSVLVCYRCGAYKGEDNNFWEDEPELGIHHATY